MSAPKKEPAKKTTKPAKETPAPPVEVKKSDGRKIRIIWGAVCLFLAICTFFGYFSSDGWFIKFMRTLCSGLFGWGFFALPVCLAVSAFALFFSKHRFLGLRVTCALLFTPVFGMFLHTVLCRIDYQWVVGIGKILWADGVALRNGGVVGGFCAVGLKLLLGSWCSAIVIILLMLLLALIALHITPSMIAERRAELKKRYAERSELIEDELPAAKKHPLIRENVPADDSRESELRSVRRAIDIPVDDPPYPPKKAKNPLFRGDGWDSAPVKPAPPVINVSPAPVPAPKPIPVSAPVFKPEPVVKPEPVFKPSPVSEPVSPPQAASASKPAAMPVATGVEDFISPEQKKLRKAEIDAETLAVGQAVESALQAEAPKYEFPSISLLTEPKQTVISGSDAEVNANAQRLDATMHNFGISANIIGITRGPTVTRYEVELEQGVRLNKLTSLADDIALSLGSSGVRIAPIPDKISIVGIEVPNKSVSTVYIRELIDSQNFKKASSKVSFAIGKDIGGNCIVGNIEKLPHMLIAGTTGSGKSVCMNSLIISLLYKSTPDEVRFIMVDPKMIELGIYNGIPHLLIPVVTDPKKAAGALQWAVTEMMKRYRLFSEINVKNITTYNAACEKDPDREKLPQVVILIDELADLMIAAAKEVEESICRIAQMARAAGMHLIIATQRPSADVITGLMKANIPSRIAFAVASSLESRIIMDTPGAEKLVGRGDMLYFPLGAGKPLRVQGTFISEEEVERVVEFVKKSGSAHYSDEIMQHIEKAAEDTGKKGSQSSAADAPSEPDNDTDELFSAAVDVIMESGQASVSMLQRRLKLGYSRAARLVDQMEDHGIVGPFEGSKPRPLLITKAQWQEMQLINGTAPADRFIPPDDEDEEEDTDDE